MKIDMRPVNSWNCVLHFAALINSEEYVEEFIQRFLNLSPLNLAKCLGVSIEPSDQSIYVLSEYIEGDSLKKIIDQRRLVSVTQLREYTSQILTALAYLQENDITHPGIKLTNILVDSENNVKLSNYIVSKPVFGSDYTVTSADSNLYKLGCILISLTNGHIIEHIPEDFEYSELPPEFCDFVHKCTATDMSQAGYCQLLHHAFILTHSVEAFKLQSASSEFQGQDHSDESEFDSQDVTFQENISDEEDDEFDNKVHKPQDEQDITCDKTSRLNKDFEILEHLGKGGYGKVMKVRNRTDKQYYAIKSIPLYTNIRNFGESNSMENDTRNKMKLEVFIFSNLSHENIVRYFASWIVENETGTSELSSN